MILHRDTAGFFMGGMDGANRCKLNAANVEIRGETKDGASLQRVRGSALPSPTGNGKELAYEVSQLRR
jgi:hypothetical protein